MPCQPSVLLGSVVEQDAGTMLTFTFPVPWGFLQFSCAAPTLSSCPEPAPEVWVCNSDGYVGQVCLLSLRAEPDVEACIAVCSARILCIGAVPGLQPRCSR